MKIFENVKMKDYSNMKIGGIAKELIIIEDKNEIEEIVKSRNNIFIIGNGTNTLIFDGYIDRTFVSLKKLNKIEELESGLVRIEAGIDFDKVLEYMELKNYGGLENLAGIPGSLGGLVYMNGGAYGTEIFDCIEAIEVVDDRLNLVEVKKDDLNIGYRKTEIKEKGWIVVSAVFKFTDGFDKEKVEELKAKRENSHPLDKPNLGSTFKNPLNHYSARLIIDAGLQGLKVGDAEISMKHPNFIVNHGEAKFEDVINLIDKVKHEVKEKSGIELDEEIIIIK